MKILLLILPLIIFVAACSEAPTPPTSVVSQHPVEKKTALADRVKKDLKGNILLQKHGLKLIVTDEKNGFVELELVEGPLDLRKGIKEGLDLESGDRATWGLLDENKSAIKAFNSLRSVIGYVKDMDGVKAVSLITKADKAEELYLEGIKYGGKKQYSLAITAFEKAAELGHLESAVSLGDAYQNGEEGINKNEKKALKYYQLAAEQGGIDGLLGLGSILLNPQSKLKDYNAGVQYLEEVAANDAKTALLISGHSSLDFAIRCARNDLAWLYATCSDSQFRDGKKAVKYAQGAYSEHKGYEGSSTLAGAYARAGNFGEATEMQKEAISMLYGSILIRNGSGIKTINLETDEGIRVLNEAKERLALYSQNKPYTEPED